MYGKCPKDKQFNPDKKSSEIMLSGSASMFIKDVFDSKYLKTCDIRDLKKSNRIIKSMINNNKLPDANSLEELLLLRSALDWQDV